MSVQTIQTVHITIDGKEVDVPKGTTVYNAAKQLGIEIPIFCYQERMPPFGACRMCLVEVANMPKLQASCTLEVMEGMVIKTQSVPAVEGRKQILELLLINHPLDCPICDRGGECPLQENAFTHGPGESRFFEEKRRFKKPLPLGPVLMLDRERCIICARCTRFGELIAGDNALEFIDRGYRTEVGTPHGEPVESKFIGNTIMICPVGALTSQVYRFRARPWDNQPTESTCPLCPVGCSLILDSRDGQIMRTRSKENTNVNDIWLCDKGWFGYEFVKHPDRLAQPLVRRFGKLEPACWEEALSLVAAKIKEAKPKGKLAAFGGNNLTTEENYLFQQLMRKGAGVNHIDHRIGMPIVNIEDEGMDPGMEMPIGACEELSYAILFGIDLTEEFPVIWLRLKQAINKGAAVLFFGHYAPEISSHLTQTILHAPGQEIRTLEQQLPAIHALQKKGGKGALFVGSQYLATSHRREILSALLQLKESAPDLTLNILEGHGNSMGARLAGMRPDMAPLRNLLDQPGLNALQVLGKAAKENWDFLYVAGANPATKFASKLWKEASSHIGFLVVQDLFLNETAQQADVVLPTLAFVEKGGSFINIEGRVQTLLPGKETPEDIYSDGEIFHQIAQKLNLSLTIDPLFADVLKQELSTPIRTKPISTEKALPSNERGDDKLIGTFAYSLFDNGVRMKHNLHLFQLAKRPAVRLHPEEGAKRSLQNGEKVRLIVNENSLEAVVRWDDRVAKGTVVLPAGFEQIPVQELEMQWINGYVIDIQKV